MENTVHFKGETNTGSREQNFTSPVPLPSGLIIASELAVSAQKAYRHGLFVRAEEVVEAGREHENYLQIVEDWNNSLYDASEVFASSYGEPDLYTISATLNSGRAPEEWCELVAVSVLQAGYLVEQYQQVFKNGLTDTDAIWAYLSLKTHPERTPYYRTFFSQETLRCPWPRLAGTLPVATDNPGENTLVKLSPYIPLGPGERIVTTLWP